MRDWVPCKDEEGKRFRKGKKKLLTENRKEASNRGRV
jgi:hypothetical protein